MGARAVNTDFIHSMRFQVEVQDTAVAELTGNRTPKQGIETGFSQVTTPAATVEAVEYREGTFVYTRKFPGNPSMEDISMMRGVTRGDSSFWLWLRKVIEGTGEYRADLDIKHFHREQALIRPNTSGGDKRNKTDIDTAKPARTYHVFEAFPTRHKVAGDLDATASDISLMEIDCAYESFEIEEHAG